MNSCDGESVECNGQGEDKNIIDKILGEMKCEFNKTEKPTSDDDKQDSKTPPSPSNNTAEEVNIKTDNGTNEDPPKENTEDTDKPRIILSFKKPNTESPVKATKDSGRRSLRQKTDEKIDESGLKRSARRRSKDCNESVLQSAIARKEKSYNESNKPQRLTRQLKPTQKILENLALAKQEKSKEKVRARPHKNSDSDSFTDFESSRVEDNDRNHRKHKHKHHNKHNKKSKRFKSDSDSDSIQEHTSPQESGIGRMRRVSTSRFKDDSNTDNDEHSPQDSLMNDENSISDSAVGKNGKVQTHLCLCTEKTQYYLANNDEDLTYCAAVDNIGDKIMGCSRSVNAKETMLLRPSTRVPYTILCDAHRNRLLRHNCCPTCGVFCTQGRFVACEAKHYYHRDCQITTGDVDCCPHCGISTPPHDVDITMHTPKRPIFLPVQKAQ